jgi:hypothetical protein
VAIFFGLASVRSETRSQRRSISSA